MGYSLWFKAERCAVFLGQKGFIFNMFQGPSAVALDTKGRVSIPTRYREALLRHAQGQLTITKDPDGCLLLYPRPDWEAFRERLQNLPMDAQRWKRIYLGNATEVEMDSNGRVLVVPELRESANISKEAMLTGQGNHFELWDKTTLRAYEAQTRYEEKPQSLKDFVI